MVVGIKDTFKLIGIMIIAACAVWVCTLFLNFQADMKEIEPLLSGEAMKAFYDALVMTGTVVCCLCGGCLLMTSIVVLCFYIKHYIDSHRKELGILKALGYSNGKIAKGFWVLGLSVLIGTAIGYVGAHSMMFLFYDAQNKDSVIPEVVIHFHPELILFLIILPALFFAIVAVLYSYLKMGAPVLDLLRGKEKVKVKASKKKTDLPFLKELQKSTVRQRKSLVFFISFASFCYGDMVQMAFSMKDLASELMGAMIFLIGVILAAVTMILAVTTVVKSSQKTLAMMKAVGYSSEECSKAVLSGYRPLSYVGFVIGTIYQYSLLQIMVNVVFKDIEGTPEYHFDFPVFFITLISFIIVYELMMLYYARQVKKISIKEVMLCSE